MKSIYFVSTLQRFSELEQWHFLVARLPKVCVLNGSHVTDDHRVDAERHFLRSHMNDESKSDRWVISIDFQMSGLISFHWFGSFRLQIWSVLVTHQYGFCAVYFLELN